MIRCYEKCSRTPLLLNAAQTHVNNIVPLSQVRSGPGSQTRRRHTLKLKLRMFKVTKSPLRQRIEGLVDFDWTWYSLRKSVGCICIVVGVEGWLKWLGKITNWKWLRQAKLSGKLIWLHYQLSVLQWKYFPLHTCRPLPWRRVTFNKWILQNSIWMRIWLCWRTSTKPRCSITCGGATATGWSMWVACCILKMCSHRDQLATVI